MFFKMISNRFQAPTLVFILSLFIVGSNMAKAEELNSLPSGKYAVDLSHASLVWKLDHLGFSTYVGRFTEFTADLDLQSQDFKQSKVMVKVDVNSIDTAYPFSEKEDFDKKLSESWFKSDEFPNMQFESTSVSDLQDNKATVSGELTLMGTTLPVTLDVTLNKATSKHIFTKKPTIGFSATTSIDRTKWGLKNYAPSVGAQVRIEIEGEFVYSDS